MDTELSDLGSEGNELPRAYVVPTRPGVKPSDLVDFVAERLAPYKRLTGGVVLVDTIPKNPSGKILRRVLRDWAKGELATPKAKL